ncbi:MAG: energy transducer TonB [Dinghuibacter sp.]|nr:energy transducer TonB [Dinghuibacter sp.]
MYNKILALVLSCMACLEIAAQEKKDGLFYLFDNADNQVTEAAKASYFINVRQFNDTTWRYDYYHIVGPRMRTETFKDEAGTQPHGRFAFYNRFGYLDSVGEAFNGRRHGDWDYYSGDDSFKIVHTKTYNRGVLVEEWDHSDSESEESSSGYVEPKFNGSFRKFLEKNLKYPKRAQSMGVANVVTVGFILDDKGIVIDPMVFRSLEYSLDHESERVIGLSSGKWNPGLKNGKPVLTYHRQSINFVLEEEPEPNTNNGRFP